MSPPVSPPLSFEIVAPAAGLCSVDGLEGSIIDSYGNEYRGQIHGGQAYGNGLLIQQNGFKYRGRSSPYLFEQKTVLIEGV